MEEEEPALSFIIDAIGKMFPSSQETELRNISVAKEDQRRLISFRIVSPGLPNLHQQQALCCPLKAPSCLLLGERVLPLLIYGFQNVLPDWLAVPQRVASYL